MDRAQVLAALRRLGELAEAHSIMVELCIYGGSAMLLAFDRQAVTRDIDAIFHPTAKVKPLIRTVAEEQHLPADWLNNEVRQFLAPNGPTRELPLDLPGLKATVPTASYLLAMKALAGRRALPGYKGDEADLRLLIKKMGIKTVSEVQEHIDRYYPDDVMSESARALITGIIKELNPE